MNNLILNIKNVGLIKEASIKVDGLTVIAGENDTGKSTVGKSLFFINGNYNKEPLDFFSSIFYFLPQELAEITFNKNEIKFNDLVHGFPKKNVVNTKFTNTEFKTIFIETPIIVNLFHFFSKLDTIQNQITKELLDSNSVEKIIIDLLKKYRANYPYILRDLYLKLNLNTEDKSSLNKFLETLKNIINGEFINVPQKGIVLKRGNQEFDINSVATGIKNFGILQLLIKNNYLTKDSILIVDEPEVHLHPKWQLQYAKFIVELVKNGVKVLITSHSPYMVEAFELYSKKEGINTNFYLASRKDSSSTIEDVNADLEPIYKKLAEPINELEELLEELDAE